MTVLAVIAVAVVGLAFVVISLVKPQLALIVLVALDVSNVNQVIADHVGTSPYKPQLALAAIIVIVMAVRRQLRIGWSPVLLGVLVLFAGFTVSLFAADDPTASLSLLAGRARDGFYFLVVFVLLLSTRAIARVVWAAVLVLAALAALTVVHQYVLHNQGDLGGLSQVPLVQEGGAFTPRHAGTSADVNFWARLLILFTPLGFSLAAAARTWWPRLFWLGCSLALMAGVYLTQSRGGFIALFVAVLLWLWLAGGRYRWSLLAVPVVVAVLVPLTGIASRLETLTAVTSSAGSGADPSVLTRKRLQLDAVRMFLDSPVFGHGIGSYVSIFPRYDRLADTYQPVTIVVAAHNFYLEQLADGGVALMLAWLVFLGTIVFAALRVRVLAVRTGDVLAARLGVGVVAGVAGWMIASVFLHLSDFRALLLLTAVTAALDVRIRRVPLPSVVVPAETVRPVRRARMRVASTLLGTVSLIVLAGAVGTGYTGYRAEATLSVLPASSTANGDDAYLIDLVSRGLIVPTFATVLGRGMPVDLVAQTAGVPATGTSVTVAESRLGGALTITAEAPSAAGAERLAAASTQLAQSRILALDSGYRVSGTSGPVSSVRPLRRWLVIPAALGVLLAGAGLVRVRRPRGGVGAHRPASDS